MKNQTTPLIALGIVVLLSTAFVPLHAAAANPASSIQVAVSGDLGSTRLTYQIPTIPMREIQAGGQNCVQFTLTHEGKMLVAGSPEMPVIARSIVIPDTAHMSVQIIDAQYKDYSGLMVVPSKGNLPRTVNPEDVPYTFGDVYTSNAWFPSEIATLSDPYVLRDFRGQTIRLCPVQYNPALGIVRVYTQITLDVTTDGTDTRNIINRAAWPESIDKDFAGIYDRQFLNFGTLRYDPIEEKGNMLIITYDAFYPDMVPFLQWKNQKGINTVMVNVSDIGNANQIKQYIFDYYTANTLTFVLFVGDAAQVPPYQYGGEASDPSDSYITNDFYSDLFVGRFSAENAAQVQTQVERSIVYERDAQAAEWYQKGTGIGSSQGTGDDNEYDYEHIRNIRTDLMNFTYTEVDELYDGSQGGEDAPGSPTPTDVAVVINEGRSFLTYCGHGWYDSWGTTGFSNSNVDTLVNTNMLPAIDSVACLVGSFASTTCFCEAWLRATDADGEPAGAIAHFGSTISQSWDPPMAAEDESVDLLTGQYPDNTRVTVGGIYYEGCMKMIDDYDSAGEGEAVYWTIFGDPSLQLRTASPETMDVAHINGIPIGSDFFDVTVDGIEGALCSVSQNGILVGSEYTDGTGVAHIQFIDGPLFNPDPVVLTVTAFNKVTYTADLLVFAGDPPVTPSVPTGPAEGNVEIAYAFSSTTTDPDNDNVSFRFDWGDGNISDWCAPVPSGGTGTVSYAWKDGGTFSVRAQARDIYHLTTNWSAPTTIHIMKPVVSIEKISSGLMGFTITVANTGDGTASMIPWNVTTKRVLDYPTILLNQHFEDNITEIAAGGTEKISIRPLLGIGNIKITINVYKEERHLEALVIGFLVIILPGY